MASVIENGIEREIIIPKETSDKLLKYKSLEVKYTLANDVGGKSGLEFIKGSVRDINEFICKYQSKEVKDECYTWFDFVFNAQLTLIKENAILIYNYLKAKDDKAKLKQLAKLVRYLDKKELSYLDYLNEPKDEQELWKAYRYNEYEKDLNIKGNMLANDTACYIYNKLDLALLEG